MENNRNLGISETTKLIRANVVNIRIVFVIKLRLHCNSSVFVTNLPAPNLGMTVSPSSFFNYRTGIVATLLKPWKIDFVADGLYNRIGVSETVPRISLQQSLPHHSGPSGRNRASVLFTFVKYIFPKKSPHE